MQIGPFRQYFLRHPAFLAELADILTNLFVRLKSGHSRSQEQVCNGYSISGGLIKLAGLVVACVMLLFR